MSNKESINYFSASFNERRRIISNLDDVKRRLKEATNLEKINELLSDILFTRQPIEVLRLLDFLLLAFQVEFQGSTYFLLNRQLQYLLESLKQDPNRYEVVVAEQEFFILKIQDYLQKKSSTSAKIKMASRAIYNELNSNSQSLKNRNIEDAAARIGHDTEHEYKSLISDMFEHQKKIILDYLEVERIDNANSEIED